MKKIQPEFGLLTAILLAAAACKTTEPQPVSPKRQSAYFSGVRDPRIYGLHIYQTPAGVEYRGGGRLHPDQTGIQPMDIQEPPRPVVGLAGPFGAEWPVLLDVTAAQSWLEFSTAQKLGAKPVGEGNVRLARPPGEEIAGCLSLVSALRLGAVHISSPLVYVRLADGPLGTMARGIEKPALKGVIGWDLLRAFEQIRFDYSEEQVLLSAAEPGAPDPQQLAAELPLVKHAGACAVRGWIDGRESLILIDPAGDFEFATDGASPVGSVRLGENPAFENPAVSDSPGGPRIGARLLQNYNLTIRPQAGTVCFENRRNGEEK